MESAASSALRCRKPTLTCLVCQPFPEYLLSSPFGMPPRLPQAKPLVFVVAQCLLVFSCPWRVFCLNGPSPLLTADVESLGTPLEVLLRDPLKHFFFEFVSVPIFYSQNWFIVDVYYVPSGGG